MDATNKAPKQGLLPDVGDLFFIAILYVLIFIVPTYVFGDGSTGWHLECGKYILATGSIPHHDLTSYTFPNAPWVAYEWGFDLFIATALKFGGYAGVLVFVSSCIALLFLLLYEECRRSGAHFLAVTILVMCGALAASLHWLARPHIFSYLALFFFVTRLERFRQGQLSASRLWIILGLTSLFWANTHPSFFIGFALILLYMDCDVVGMLVHPTTQRNEYLTRLKSYLIALVVSIAASLINPYGWELYSYIFKYLTASNAIVSHTLEYQAMTLNGTLWPSCFEALIAIAIFSLAFGIRRASLSQVSVFLVFMHMAMQSVRSVPIFVVATLPFISRFVAQANFLPENSPFTRISQWLSGLDQKFSKSEHAHQLHLLPVAVVLILFSITILQQHSAHPLIVSGFDSRKFPVQTATYILAHKLPINQGYNFDNWGGYLRHRFGIPVFIDDRVDFYGEKFYLDYAHVFWVDANWQKILDQNHISWVILPKDSRLIDELKEHPEWKLACSDAASDLFVRVLPAPDREQSH